VAAGASLEDDDLRRGETAVSDRKPRKGDVVLVTFKAEYEGDGRDGSPPRVKVEKGGMPALISVADDSSFEVVEPADDPSKDPIGTVRQCPDADVVAVRTEWCHEHESGSYRWRLPATGGARPTSVLVNDEHVEGWPVIGAVPGTPAAEANPVPPQVLERVREMLSNGQQIRAIKAIREVCVGMGLKEAKAYAESLPEWAEGDQALAGQIRDGLNLSPHGWEPRVFHAKGDEPPDEPPDDVASVVDVQGDHLDRVGAVWIGRGGDGYPLIAKPWENHVLAKYAPYREVQP
jgi:hypothetical protein